MLFSFCVSAETLVFSDVSNNYAFTDPDVLGFIFADDVVKSGDSLENNRVIKLPENPHPRKPSIGDCRIRDDAAESISCVPYIPFEIMGIY